MQQRENRLRSVLGPHIFRRPQQCEVPTCNTQLFRAAAEREKAAVVETAPRERRRAPRLKKGRSFREEREFQALPERLEALEAELEQVGSALSDPAIYRDSPDEVARLSTRSTELPQEIETLYARWEELETLGPR